MFELQFTRQLPSLVFSVYWNFQVLQRLIQIHNRSIRVIYWFRHFIYSWLIGPTYRMPNSRTLLQFEGSKGAGPGPWVGLGVFPNEQVWTSLGVPKSTSLNRSAVVIWDSPPRGQADRHTGLKTLTSRTQLRYSVGSPLTERYLILMAKEVSRQPFYVPPNLLR